MHAEKKTSSKDLRYRVRVNITPDEEFKSDIIHIRREAEQKLIGALTRYHYRRAESNKIKLKKAEQRPNVTRGKKTKNPEFIKNRPRPDIDNRTENVVTLRKSALQQKPQKVQNGLMPFVTQYNPSVSNLKKILMRKWHLIEDQPLLREIYREPPFIFYRKGKSLKDTLVRAKL